MKNKIRISALITAVLMLCSCSESKGEDNDNKRKTYSIIKSEYYEKACNKQLYGFWCKETNEEGIYDISENKYYTFSDDVFAVSYNGYLSYYDYDKELYGYTDFNKNTIIDARYDQVKIFTESGVAAVCKDELWGYINTKGKFVIEPEFTSAGNFSKDGIARVTDTNDKIHYIDLNGDYIPELEKYDYSQSMSFSDDGTAFAGNTAENTCGIINTKGEYLCQLETTKDISGNMLCPDIDKLSEGYYKYTTDVNTTIFIKCRNNDGNLTETEVSEDEYYIPSNRENDVKNDCIKAYNYTNKQYGEINLQTGNFESATNQSLGDDYFDYDTNGYRVYCEYDGQGAIYDLNGNVVSEKNAEYWLLNEYEARYASFETKSSDKTTTSTTTTTVTDISEPDDNPELPDRSHSEGINRVLGAGYTEGAQEFIDLLGQNVTSYPVEYNRIDNKKSIYFVNSQTHSQIKFLGLQFTYCLSDNRTTDDNTYHISFYFSPSHYDITYSNGRIICYGGQSKSFKECQLAYDLLYDKLYSYYGEPDEIHNDKEKWAQWDNTADGDIWLCVGENLWGNEGYNDVILSYTQSGFDWDTIYDYDNE